MFCNEAIQPKKRNLEMNDPSKNDVTKAQFIELPDFIAKFVGHPNLFYCPNNGNAGDALIFAGEMQVFGNAGIKYTVMDPLKDKVSGKTILYAGGGNLNELYGNCANFLSKYAKKELGNIIYVLPHTINGRETLLKSLGDNVHFLCREKRSWQHVMKNFRFPNNVFLSHDAAFYLNLDVLFKGEKLKVEKQETLWAFRTDREKKDPGFWIDPKKNVDVSGIFPAAREVYGEKRVQCARDFLRTISKHGSCKTNRLHVSIGAALLGRPVEIWENSYWKNRSIYEHSFAHFKAVNENGDLVPLSEIGKFMEIVKK